MNPESSSSSAAENPPSARVARLILKLIGATIVVPTLLLEALYAGSWIYRRLNEPEGVDHVEAVSIGPASSEYWVNNCCAFGLGHNVIYSVADASGSKAARDSKIETVWRSSSKGCGADAGGALEFAPFLDYEDGTPLFDWLPEDFELGGLVVAGGWASGELNWKSYARPKRLWLSIDERPIAEIELQDVNGTQKAVFRRRWLLEGSRVRVEVLESFCGDDPSLPVAISEIDLTRGDLMQ